MGKVTAVTAADFDREVVERSRQMPVVVDFWAAWCGPCRMIAPVVERLAGEMEGRVAFAKLDTDAEPAVAQRYQIRSLPTLMMFVGGEPVDQLLGALPEPAIREFIESRVPSPALELAARAEAALEAGELESADALFAEARALDPELARVALGRARLALARGEPAAALAALEAIGPVADEADRAEALRAAARLVAAAGDVDPAAAGSEGLWARGLEAFASGDYDAALERFLELVKSDRKLGDDAGRKAMLTVFGVLGDADPRVKEYRRKLMILL